MTFIAHEKECPTCGADVTDSWQDYDPSVGIMSCGWYCEECKEPIEYDPPDFEDDYT